MDSALEGEITDHVGYESALVYVNTLMLQDILGEPEWTDLLTPADRRGLTPLFWLVPRPLVR